MKVFGGVGFRMLFAGYSLRPVNDSNLFFSVFVRNCDEVFWNGFIY